MINLENFEWRNGCALDDLILEARRIEAAAAFLSSAEEYECGLEKQAGSMGYIIEDLARNLKEALIKIGGELEEKAKTAKIMY